MALGAPVWVGTPPGSRQSEMLTWSSPGVLSSASGLLTVLVNVYASHDGAWSPPATAALSIVLLTLSYALIAFATYRFWFLQSIK